MMQSQSNMPNDVNSKQTTNEPTTTSLGGVPQAIPSSPYTNNTVIPQPAIIYNYTPQPTRLVHKKATKVIGILQIITGALSIIFGLTFLLLGINDPHALDGNGPFGIAGILPGIMIIATGIIALFSSRNPYNGCLNGLNMAFSIFCCLIAIGNISAFSITLIVLQECNEFTYLGERPWLRICTQKTTGLALAFTLLVLYFIEFFISLMSSIYTCLFYECCKQCCRGTADDVIPNHPPPLNAHQQPPYGCYPQQNFGYHDYTHQQNAFRPPTNEILSNEVETMNPNEQPPSYDDQAKLL